MESLLWIAYVQKKSMFSWYKLVITREIFRGRGSWEYYCIKIKLYYCRLRNQNIRLHYLLHPLSTLHHKILRNDYLAKVKHSKIMFQTKYRIAQR